METPVTVCFLAQSPLGRLAKWLRILGFDTLYEPEVPKHFSDHMEKERVWLTRTRNSSRAQAAPFSLFIRSDHVKQQLRQVIREVGLSRSDTRPFSRCIRCNQSIQRVDKGDVLKHIPDHVWETHEAFFTCTSCHRIYWPGTHAERAGSIIAAVFDDL